MHNGLFRIIFIPALWLLAACDKGAYDLRFHPPHQTQHHLTWKTEGEMVMGLLGQKIRTRMNHEVVSQVQFDTLPDGKTAVSFWYTQYRLSQKANGKEVVLNPDTDEDSVARSVLRSLMDIRFRAVASPQGKLTRVTSGDSVWNSLEKLMGGLQGDEKARIGAPLRSLINDDMFVGLMEQCFYIFPQGKVDVGDTWRNQIRMRSIFSMNIHNTYELVDVTNGVAHIRLTSKVANATHPGPPAGLAMATPLLGEPPAKSGVNLLGMTLDAKFDGTQEGEFYVDAATGLLRSGYIRQNLQGLMKFNDIEFPMALNLVNNYSMKKM